MSENKRKRGRPLKPTARRNRIDIRMNDDEYRMLAELSEMYDKCRNDILTDSLRTHYDRLTKK